MNTMIKKMSKFFCLIILSLLNSSQRSMIAALQQELAQLEVELSYLARHVLKEQEIPKPEIHKRKDFFKDIMGIEEALYQNDPSMIKNSIKKKGDTFFIVQHGTQREFQAGQLKIFSIKELRDRAEQTCKATHDGVFNVIEAIHPAGQSYRRYVDIGAMQANPANKNAVFQVASNFNALELTSKYDNMADITRYIADPTQGPFASIAAAPGLIYRHYYFFYDPATSPVTWRQTPKNQLNLLQNTPIPVANSYVDLSLGDPQKILNNLAVENIQVAVHQDVQVVFGYLVDSAHHETVPTDNQIITQVFTAAVDFAGANWQYKNQPAAVQIAQAVLDAAYEGTIKAAAVLNKKKVYLTLVGGGVFGNEPLWITRAIEKNKEFIKRCGLDVTLIIYDGSKIPKSDPSREIIEVIVRETGGLYLRYSS